MVAFALTTTQAAGETWLLTNVEFDGLPAEIKRLDPVDGAIIEILVPGDFQNNGNLLPIEDIKAGPNRTIFAAQPGGDGKIGQYDEFGNFLGNFLGGQPVQAENPVDNIRGMVRSADGAFLFTADWTGDNVHRFDFFTAEPAPIAGDPLGEFVAGMQPPPDLDQAQAVEVLNNGELLLADIGQGKLLRYDAASGALIGTFVAVPATDIVGNVRDIDVQPNGDVVLAQSGNGGAVKHFSADGDLLNSFGFSGPAGVHLLPDGNYLVASASTFGQGRGLFRVSPNGTILETIDNTRSYGALELITLVEGATAVPTASHWSVLLTTLLMLVVGSIFVGSAAKSPASSRRSCRRPEWGNPARRFSK